MAALTEKAAAINGEYQEVSKVKSTGGKADAYVASANHETKREFVKRPSDPIRVIAEHLASGGPNRNVIVLDNFEQALSNQSLISEIGSLIMLLDDDDYADLNLSFCIVGVPADIRDLIARSSKATPIVNRLTEIPEVQRLTSLQCKALLKKGLFDLLKLKSDISEKRLTDIIYWYSDGIAQHIQSLALAISTRAVSESRSITESGLVMSLRDWVESSFMQDYTVCENLMNSNNTEIGRRNQVLYSLSRIQSEDFKVVEIEEIVTDIFFENAAYVTLNVNQIMADLSKRETPIIRRTPKGNAYRFCSPKYRMMLRLMLEVTEENRVAKRDLSTGVLPWKSLPTNLP